MVAPAVVTNWGLGLSASHGMTLRVDGLADKRTYLGELPAMERLCRMLPANSAVVFLEYVDAREMEQDVRSMCGVPSAGYLHDNGHQSARASDAPGVLSVVRDVQRAGRVPVLLSYDEGQLTPYRASGTVKHVFALYTTYDAGTLHGPPKTPRRNTVDVWMWSPSG